VELNKLPDKKPTESFDDYWIYAFRKNGTYKKSINPGKWLIFEDISFIDTIWTKLKKATEDGILGYSSKVATAKYNPNATDPNTKVICVYTYDWKDEEDVMKIREELRKLGITKKIPYKSDEDTNEGKYQVKGNTRISKYYC
jgi:hypothetical protein